METEENSARLGQDAEKIFGTTRPLVVTVKEWRKQPFLLSVYQCALSTHMKASMA